MSITRKVFLVILVVPAFGIQLSRTEAINQRNGKLIDSRLDSPSAYETPCPDSSLLHLTPIQWYLAYTCATISGVCLALFVAERACRSGRLVWLYPGRTVHALAWTLLLAHLTFLAGVGRDEVQAVCSTVAAVLHYLLLATFFWLNVMCIDIFRCFFFVTYRPVAGRLFVRSALYAWGVPALVVALSVGLDEVQELTADGSPAAVRPCYARGGVCFFGSAAGFGVLFVVPAFLLLLVDGLAFAAIVFWMRDSRAEAAQRRQEAAALQQAADANEQPAAAVKRQASLNPASLRRRRSSAISSREHHRFKVYVRLAVVLTVPWCCGVAAAVGGFPFLWYAAAMLIGLQGAFLFVAFGAKRRLTQMAWKKATGKPLRRRTTREHRDKERTALDKHQAAKSVSASAASVNDVAAEQQVPSQQADAQV